VRYLYGDGVESPLSINYLEYLRLVLEFSASLLKSQAKEEAQYAAAKKRKQVAQVELKHLRALQRIVDAALDTASSKIKSPVAAGCVEKLRALGKEEISRAEESYRFNLSVELGRIQDAVDSERAENERRLEKVLLHYDLPESDQLFGLRAQGENGYEVEVITQSRLGVDAGILLTIPEGHRLSRPLRVDALDADLVITLPHSGGWGGKSNKVRPQKLAKEYVVSLAENAEGVALALRTPFPDGQSGYDIIFGEARVAITRVSKQGPDDPFTAGAEDAARLVSLMRAVYRSMGELADRRRVLKWVQFEGVPLRQHPEPTKLVRRLLRWTGPVVQEIMARSLSPGELVLKRVLGDDRREEVFASVSELRQIYDDLDEGQRQWFSSLGFDWDDSGSLDAATSVVISAPEVSDSVVISAPEISESTSTSIPPPFSAPRSGPPSIVPALPRPSVPVPSSAAREPPVSENDDILAAPNPSSPGPEQEAFESDDTLTVPMPPSPAPEPGPEISESDDTLTVSKPSIPAPEPAVFDSDDTLTIKK
jgi:hypothetical protein